MRMVPVHPGRLLKREMAARDLSANALARALRAPPGRIIEIVNGKRAISPETALRLRRPLRKGGRAPGASSEGGFPTPPLRPLPRRTFMDFTLSPEIEGFRRRVRDFVAAEILPLETDPASYDAHENIAPAALARLRAKAKAA